MTATTGSPPPRPDQPPPVSRVERVLPALFVVGPAAATFVIPFFGPAVALLTPVLAGALGDRVWPVRKWVAASIGIVILVVIWVVIAGLAPVWGNTDAAGFLLIPLCAPDEIDPWAVSALAAVVGYGAVAAVSVKVHAIWLWPIAAAVGAGLYATVWELMEDSIRWIC